MSLFTDRLARGRQAAPVGPQSPPPSAVLAGGEAAVRAGAGGLLVFLVPVIAVWAADPSGANWGNAVRVALNVWLVAHGTGIAIPGGHIGLTPLGLLAVPALTCWASALRMMRSLDPPEAGRGGRGQPARPPVAAVVAFALTYAVVAGGVSLGAGTAVARALTSQAFIGAAVIAAATVCLAAAAYRAGGVRAGVSLLADAARVPDRTRVWLDQAVVALAALLLATTAVGVVAVAIAAERVLALHRALDPGVVGGSVLALGQAAVMPNVGIWVAALAAGPGFAFGSGTSITQTGTTLGALPSIPLLGALPVPGEAPSWMRALLVLPVLAGAVGAGWVRRPSAGRAGSGRRFLDDVLDVAAAALFVGCGFAVLAWASGGAVGPGRLADVGPDPWLSAGAVAGEVGAGGLLVVLACRAWSLTRHP
jgi:hypothetical protein